MGKPIHTVVFCLSSRNIPIERFVQPSSLNKESSQPDQ